MNWTLWWVVAIFQPSVALASNALHCRQRCNRAVQSGPPIPTPLPKPDRLTRALRLE